MEEVAKELGYDSLAYFDRVFKKYTDMTPLQYRKMKKKNNRNPFTFTQL